jgi:hypothetical protein
VETSKESKWIRRIVSDNKRISANARYVRTGEHNPAHHVYAIGRLMTCRLMTGRLMTGRLMTGRLITRRLMACRLMTCRLMTRRLMTGRPMTWKYKINSLCPSENTRTPLNPIPSKESKKESPVQSSSPSSVKGRMEKKEKEVEGREK